MPLSIDLRKRVIAAIDEGMRATDAAKLFKVCRKGIYNWLNLRKETGDLNPKVGYQNGHSHSITDWYQFKIFAETNKYCTINEMVIRWNASNTSIITETTMQRALKKIDFSFKKKRLTTSKLSQKNVKII